MDFFAVFSFFSENSILTPQQRLLELVCVSVLAAVLAAATAGVFIRKVKHSKAAKPTETEQTHDSRKEQ